MVTVNDQHIMMSKVALAAVSELQGDLESIIEVLSSGPAPKRDPEAVNLTRALMAISVSIGAAQAHATLAERKLRYSRTRDAGSAVGASEDCED